MERFRGISWENEGEGRGLDAGASRSVRGSSVAGGSGEPASISHDWAAGKV